jgi:glycerophosphoryl diester phosphodiesterase
MSIYIEEIKECIKNFKKNAKQIILFELIFNAILVGTTYLLSKLIFTLSLKVNHIEYISNETFWPWLRSPITIIILFSAFTIWLFLSIIEIAAMIRNFNTSKKLNCWQMFYLGYIDAKKIFDVKSTKLTWYLTVIIPAMGALGAFNINKSVYIPEYIETYINSRPILLTLNIIFLIVLYFYSIKWIFIVFYFLLKKNDLKYATNEYRKKMKKDILHVVIGRLLITIYILLLFAIVTFLALGIIILFCKIFLSTTNGYNVSLQACYWLPYIITFIAQFISVPLTISYISIVFNKKNKLFRRLKDAFILKKLSFNKKLVSIFAIILAVIINSLVIYSSGLEKYQAFRKPDNIPAITAHRGASIAAPENTIAAFDEAISEKSDWIELDVHETKDGVLIISHDANLKRITGKKAYVYNLNYNEIEKLNIITNINYPNTKIPTLEDVFKECQGKVKINIELKPTGHEKSYVDKVLDLINQYNIKGDIEIASMNLNVLKEVKERDPDITIIYNMTIANGDISKLDFIDVYSVEESYITDDLINKVHKANKKIYAWTVNDANTIRKLADMGVDNIITDNPLLARKILVVDHLDQKYSFLHKIFNI